MKTITLILLFCLMLSYNLFGTSPIKCDTVRINLGDILIELASAKLDDKSVGEANLVEKFQLLLKRIEQVEIVSPGPGERIRIKLRLMGEEDSHHYEHLFLKTEIVLKKELVIDKESILEKDKGKYVVEYEDNNYLIRTYLNDLKELKILSEEKSIEKIEEAGRLIPSTPKKQNGWLVMNENGKFDEHFLPEVPPKTLDMIFLSAGAGGGWVKNQFVSDIHLKVGLGFAKKGIMRNNYFAEYEYLYDFSNNSSNNIFQTNQFLNIGIEKNLSNDPEKDKWYGASFGYLIKRHGHFFEKNTMKIKFHKRLNNSVTLQPELYFNNFFKNVYPGLRVQFSF